MCGGYIDVFQEVLVSRIEFPNGTCFITIIILEK